MKAQITIEIDLNAAKESTTKLFEKITRDQQWNQFSDQLVSFGFNGQSIFGSFFHEYWTVAGHNIRGQIGDDARLFKFLRILLPPYKGPERVLFRGENLQRWKVGSIGPCWSEKIEKARMFGRGLNSVNGGGLLLRSCFPSEAIIAGPSAHSLWLGENEFTIDTSVIDTIDTIESYPPHDE